MEDFISAKPCFTSSLIFPTADLVIPCKSVQSCWNFPQAALAGGGTTRTTNLGGVYITVNGYNARNDDELAQTVADKINGMIHEDDSVFK